MWTSAALKVVSVKLDEVMMMLPPRQMVCTRQRGIRERHDIQAPLLAPQMQTSHHNLKLSFPNTLLWKMPAKLALKRLRLHMTF